MAKTVPKELCDSVVIMAAVLASYGCALLLEDAAHLHVDVVIQAVALGWTLAWTQRDADLVDRGLGFLVLPAVAMGAAWADRLMSDHTVAGDALFALAVAGSLWIRRFGPRATRAGTLAALPFVATLVVQGPIGTAAAQRDGHVLWMGLVALIAACCVLVVQVAAGYVGLGERVGLKRPVDPVAVPPPSLSPRSGGGKGWGRLRVSTRMALQMGAALGAAFLVGHLAYPDHWTWAVLTAFIVCSGARGRGDVLYKGATRTFGAAFGTAAATGIVGLFGPQDPWAVVLLFAVLALATWLRPLNYAYWAACVTAAFSLLYGYFGQADLDILGQRLQAIAVGAVVGVAASWLVAPVRTVDVVRRRVADALAALADVLRTQASPGGSDPELPRHRARFDVAVGLLDQVAPPLRTHRALLGRVWAGEPSPHLADAVDAVHACVEPVRALARVGAADAEAVLANVALVRRAIGRLPGPAYQPAAVQLGAVREIDAALGRIAQVFPSAAHGQGAEIAGHRSEGEQ
ncbi:FUSC family protein [Streptomyces geranii]|uniref:FUSC family protein n=1 Tax=Streptomyces geranii TaxID=2058923 RepID=UPI000D02E2EC|nr:FUSC family protein [Streptomyces geranii]